MLAMQIPWPRSAEAVGSFTSLDVFSWQLPGVRPECLIGNVGSDAYYAVTAAKLYVLMLVVMGPHLAAVLCDRCTRYQVR